MAWICLAELAESDSHSPSSESEQSHIVSKTDTHRAFYCPECNRVRLIELQYGMTSEHCLKNCCRKLILFSEDFHAKTSALQDLEMVWRGSEADFSTKLSDSQKKFDRILCSLKMSQPLELEDWSKLSKHLPKSGMTVGGRVFLPQALERHTSEKDGSYLPTPTASAYGTGGNGARKGKQKQIVSLNTMARKNLWPTPCSLDWKDNGKSPAELKRNSTTLATIAGGQLSPMWVEWLMGYRCGWTELSASVTQWFRCK